MINAFQTPSWFSPLYAVLKTKQVPNPRLSELGELDVPLKISFISGRDWNVDLFDAPFEMSLPGRRPLPVRPSAGRTEGTSGRSRKSALPAGGGVLPAARSLRVWTKILLTRGLEREGPGRATRAPGLRPGPPEAAGVWPGGGHSFLQRSEGPLGGSFEVCAQAWRSAARLLLAEGGRLVPRRRAGDRCHGFSPSARRPRAA